MNLEQFSSFWEHYQATHEWFRNFKNYYSQTEFQENLIVEEVKQEEISPEFVEFRRITMEHRKQRRFSY